MQIFGHRGAAGLAPENTLESFQLAIDLHVDGLEFDVRCSRDGTPVVIHDETLDRTTAGHGKVTDHPASQLIQLGIPTLRQVLEQVIGRVNINVELKTRDAARATVRLLETFLNRRVAEYAHLLLTCFDIETVRELRQVIEGQAEVIRVQADVIRDSTK